PRGGRSRTGRYLDRREIDLGEIRNRAHQVATIPLFGGFGATRFAPARLAAPPRRRSPREGRSRSRLPPTLFAPRGPRGPHSRDVLRPPGRERWPPLPLRA